MTAVQPSDPVTMLALPTPDFKSDEPTRPLATTST